MTGLTGKPSIAGSGLSDLKRRLLFVLVALIVFRIGSYIPVPGLDPQKFAEIFQKHQNGFVGMFNMFSGGALQRFSLFALGVMPYISASIIMQLLSTVLPSLEAIKKEGQSGQRKINQYTRYGTVLLAFFQGLGIARMLGASAALDPGLNFYFTASVTLVTGTVFLMWLGEQITEYGIGNGISLIIFAGIVARLIPAAGDTFSSFKSGQMQGVFMFLILLAIVAVVAFVVFMERGQRKIAINYATRQQGNKMYRGQSSHLPLKINMSGVIPAIFATSIILFPATIAAGFKNVHGMGWLETVSLKLQVGTVLYSVLFAAAVIFFSFFYTALVFNPRETADQLKKSNALVPGIRPGEQTAKYIDYVMTRITLAGALYVALVCLVPQEVVIRMGLPFNFGGTSLLIVVVVIMDFIAQVQSHIMSSQYESLMKKKGSGLNLLR